MVAPGVSLMSWLVPNLSLELDLGSRRLPVTPSVISVAADKGTAVLQPQEEALFLMDALLHPGSNTSLWLTVV